MRKSKERKDRIKCPHCDQIKDDWRQIANHLIAYHGETAEAGAAMTSLNRLKELLK